MARQMLLMGVTPTEQIYGVLDDETMNNGVVVGSNYVNHVPLWGYLTRVPDMVSITSPVHDRLWDKPAPLRLSVGDQKKVKPFLADVLDVKFPDVNVDDDFDLKVKSFRGPLETKAKFTRKFEPYDPDAQDGDGDGIVQDGTPWERPAASRIVDAAGRELRRGLDTATRPAGTRIVDADGKPLKYTPRSERDDKPDLGNVIGGDAPEKPSEPGLLEKPAEGKTPLSDHGTATLKERGLRSVRDVANPTPPPPKPEPKPEPEKKPAPRPKTSATPESDKLRPRNPSRPVTVYHGTSRQNVESILENGVRASDPTGGDPDMEDDRGEAVYFGDLDEILMSEDEDGFDLEFGDTIIAIQVAPEDIKYDPSTGHSYYSGNIPADRVRLVTDLAKEREYHEAEVQAWRDGKEYPDPTKPIPVMRRYSPAVNRTGADQRAMLATIFEQMDTYTAKHGSADAVLEMIVGLQGFDGLPGLVETTEELPVGDVLHRGVIAMGGQTAGDLAETFRTGGFFIGTGMYGNGIYVTSNLDLALNTYAVDDESGLLTMALRPEANIIDLKDLKPLAEQLHKVMTEQLGWPARNAYQITNNNGRVAAILGYDGYRPDLEDWPHGTAAVLVMLNRSAIVVTAKAEAPQQLVKPADIINFADKNFDTLMRAEQELAGGDPVLGAIAALRGFDGPPRLVDFPDDLPEGLRFHRGVGRSTATLEEAARQAEMFRTGDFFPGIGLQGSGTYLTSSRLEAAMNYAHPEDTMGQRSVIDMVLDPDLTILEKDRMWRVMMRVNVELDRREVDATRAEQYRLQQIRRFLNDPGRLAAAMGYDGYQPHDASMYARMAEQAWGKRDHLVLLNRTVATVARKPAERQRKFYQPAKTKLDSSDEIFSHLMAYGDELLRNERRSPAGGDVTLDAIYQQQGFDVALPRTVETEADLPDEERRFYRGIGGSTITFAPRDSGNPQEAEDSEYAADGYEEAVEYVEQFRSGRHYPGTGVSGSGTYMSLSEGMVREHYMHPQDRDSDSPRTMLVASMNPDARLIDYDDIVPITDAIYDRLELMAQEDPEAAARYEDLKRLVRNSGRVAAMMGYDGMRVRTSRRAPSGAALPGVLVLFNRSALTVVADPLPNN